MAVLFMYMCTIMMVYGVLNKRTEDDNEAAPQQSMPVPIIESSLETFKLRQESQDDVPVEEQIRYRRPDEMPVGYRFTPSDIILISRYLIKKVQGKPLPPDLIRDIQESEFYANHPRNIVPQDDEDEDEDESYYFFIQPESNFNLMKRYVRGRIGYWEADEFLEAIPNARGTIVGLKATFSLFWRTEDNYEMTRWRMEEFQLAPQQGIDAGSITKWVLVKIVREHKPYEQCDQNQDSEDSNASDV